MRRLPILAAVGLAASAFAHETAAMPRLSVIRSGMALTLVQLTPTQDGTGQVSPPATAVPANGGRPSAGSSPSGGDLQTNGPAKVTTGTSRNSGTLPNPYTQPFGNNLVDGPQPPNGTLSNGLQPQNGYPSNGTPQQNSGTQYGTAQPNGALTSPGAGLQTGINPRPNNGQPETSYYTRRPLGASPVTRDITGPFGGYGGYDARGVYTGTAQQPYSYGQVYATERGLQGGLLSNGVDATGPLRPFIPPLNGTIHPNSGYGLPNGSRPSHMDARGIQRYD